MMDLRTLDRWLTREPWFFDPMTEPHAPWVVVFVSREGDHYGPFPTDKEVAAGGSWAVQHGGDEDGETLFVACGHTQESAQLSCDRMNALYAYVTERDRDPVSGICRVCGDLHEEAR